MRRSPKKIPQKKIYNDPGGNWAQSSNTSAHLGVATGSNRPRANSSDIAMERGPPTYPSAKKSEGKILRPQYKEILRGELHAQIAHPYN